MDCFLRIELLWCLYSYCVDVVYLRVGEFDNISSTPYIYPHLFYFLKLKQQLISIFEIINSVKIFECTYNIQK